MKMVPCPQANDPVILSPFEGFPETNGKIVIPSDDPPVYSYEEDNWQVTVNWTEAEDTMNVRWDGEAKVWRDCE